MRLYSEFVRYFNERKFPTDGVDFSDSVEEFVAPEPKKYMGGNIPSRSFKMLQAMTDQDDDGKIFLEIDASKSCLKILKSFIES